MTKIGPLFPFYGSKYRLAKYYPLPIYDTIIEPFAGSAAYSQHYPDLEVFLYEIDPVVYSTLNYLIVVTKEEINSLRTDIDHVDELINGSQDQRWMVGRWLNPAASGNPRKARSTWGKSVSGSRSIAYWGGSCRQRISNSLPAIRHWKVFNKPYQEIENQEATWFIDPPYIEKGKYYKFGSKLIDYKELAEWCKSRKGQVIVCENEGADWLDFKPFRDGYTQKTNGTKSKEVVWYRENDR